jgi:hypothetical protein
MDQFVAVSPPFSVIDWTVAMVFIPVMTVSNPGNIELVLFAPNLYTVYFTMSGFYNLNGCNTLNGIPIYDNNTVIWGSSSTTSVCSATAYTAYSTGYQDPSGNWLCFSGSSCSFGSQSGTYVSDPFALTYQKGGGTVAGTWQFSIIDDDGGNSLTSWTLQFYRESYSFLLLSFLSLKRVASTTSV